MPGNYPKKPDERRDSQGYKQSPRKNLSGGKRDSNNVSFVHTLPNVNNQKAQAAGAEILSAVISPKWSGSAQQQQQALGLNGLNRGEVVEFLNMRYSDSLTSYQDTNLNSSVRPEKYESKSVAALPSAWGRNNNEVSVWGQQSKDKTGTLANGIDFLIELATHSK